MIEINVKAKKASPWSTPLTTLEALRNALDTGIQIGVFRKNETEVYDYIQANSYRDDTWLSGWLAVTNLTAYDYRTHATNRVFVYKPVITKKLVFGGPGAEYYSTPTVIVAPNKKLGIKRIQQWKEANHILDEMENVSWMTKVVNTVNLQYPYTNVQ